MKHIATLLTGLLLAGVSPAAAMTIGSSDFIEGAAIPAPHIYPRCGGQNVSPQLSWHGAPAGTKSFVLTMIDVDVKPSGWSHWIIVDLPPDTTSLARGFTALPGRARALASNFGDLSYDGPCPPAGTGMHHYQLTIWAMPEATTAIAPDAPAAEVSALLAKTARDHATLTGWVKR